LQTVDAKREIAIIRELTKVHEQCLRGSVETLLSKIQNMHPKGEFVLLIKGKQEGDPTHEIWPDIPEHVEQLQQQFGLSLPDAMKRAAVLRGIPKREIYRIIHGLDQ
jgi:16S rRNA (cytidine1402-2'-O)-methyltransferase